MGDTYLRPLVSSYCDLTLQQNMSLIYAGPDKIMLPIAASLACYAYFHRRMSAVSIAPHKSCLNSHRVLLSMNMHLRLKPSMVVTCSC